MGLRDQGSARIGAAPRPDACHRLISRDDVGVRRLVLGAVALAVIAAAAGCTDPRAATRGSAASASPVFTATFETSSDFFGRFDYGYSGLVAPQNGHDPATLHFRGDHNMACEAPTTLRDVNILGTPEKLDFSQLFWHCAPGGDAAKGHVMTAVDTTGYNIAWFSPKGYFTNVSKVCWDINETEMSRRKWTQVLFVSPADAVRYPSGSRTTVGGVPSTARGTGGFDLGYTAPDFRDNGGPSAGLFPQGGTLAGLQDLDGSASWFQNQDTYTSRFLGPDSPDREQTTDKAARYKHCLTNGPNNTVEFTKDTAGGPVTRELSGQIPQGRVRVVFQDDNYNPPKDDRYDPNVVTWHWDNIHVESQP